MKALVAILSFLFISTGAFAQRASNHPINNSPFGNVLFPAGKPATGQPFGHVPSPGVRGGGNGFNRGGNVIYVPYAYPVVTGGYYGGYGFGYDSGYGYGAGVPQQQQPNVTVVYPAQQQTPVIIMGNPPGQPGDVPRSSIQDYPPQPQAPPSADTSGAQADTPYYLLAFKDHSIYSAIGYWVDGDTLHYLATGNVHNQVSLSLVDRDLTTQLNRGRGVQVILPPAR